jgi:nitrite reductase/ring-hydroxylating ferredoxin subunit
MRFVKTARVWDVPAGGVLKVEHEGLAILVANVGGSLYAILLASLTLTKQP